jgi:ribose-phosphate pyrophosphokinase
LAKLNVKDIVTFDAHDVGMQNAVPLTSFENFYPTMTILNSFVRNEDIDLNNMLIVSPDTGAVDRARLYADIFSTNVGMFYKRRDLTKVVNGKNPIIEHKYIGDDVKGKNVIVVDDMISSGDSMIDVAKSLKALGAEKVYLIATFSLFSNGIENFKKAYAEGLFERVYSTNLSYVNSEYDKEDWFVKVDCSRQIAKIIEHLNKKMQLTELLDDRKKITKCMQKMH